MYITYGSAAAIKMIKTSCQKSAGQQPCTQSSRVAENVMGYPASTWRVVDSASSYTSRPSQFKVSYGPTQRT